MISDQIGNIIPALSERWHLDVDYIDSVEQVLAKASRSYQIIEALVGGTDQSDIGGHFGFATDRPYRFFLNRSQ